MASEMSQFKATANDHMRREMKNGGKWVCDCEACRGIRSLVGVDKMLDVRPLVRAIEQLADELDGLPDGPRRQSLLKQSDELQDKLAEVMAKES